MLLKSITKNTFLRLMKKCIIFGWFWLYLAYVLNHHEWVEWLMGSCSGGGEGGEMISWKISRGGGKGGVNLSIDHGWEENLSFPAGSCTYIVIYTTHLWCTFYSAYVSYFYIFTIAHFYIRINSPLWFTIITSYILYCVFLTIWSLRGKR